MNSLGLLKELNISLSGGMETYIWYKSSGMTHSYITHNCTKAGFVRNMLCPCCHIFFAPDEESPSSLERPSELNFFNGVFKKFYLFLLIHTSLHLFFFTKLNCRLRKFKYARYLQKIWKMINQGGGKMNIKNHLLYKKL